MRIEITTYLNYKLSQQTHLLLQIEAAAMPDQRLINTGIGLSDTLGFNRVAAHDGIGDRIWLQMDEAFLCDYTAIVEINRPCVDLAAQAAVVMHELPADTVQYLLPSRYCHTDEFSNFVDYEFAGLVGGARVDAMASWIEDRFAYAPGTSTSATTDLEVFAQREGICRDFAHVLVSLCRASAIPARFVSCYAPDVAPPDFHAVVEVYLAGQWHLVDPTGMAQADTIARIGVGRDAADVAFLTSFAPIEMLHQSVSVKRV